MNFRRRKRALALGNRDDSIIRYEAIFVLGGDADIGILLVVDEDREGIGVLIVEVTADILEVRLFLPPQKSAYLFARVLSIEHEIGIFVSIEIIPSVPCESKINQVQNRLAELIVRQHGHKLRGSHKLPALIRRNSRTVL